jgi:hypothetical protein
MRRTRMMATIATTAAMKSMAAPFAAPNHPAHAGHLSPRT